ncbi:MAG TPA: bifunctional alpha,alpha-trehalose-phosphate synthase (UDP-forming)/trehalose-phosphatase [Phycisphaerales bacterium]|nr:bifunctional alpha,alpha-trehalose-phosphate synthase (UDP-forming)/trehalose-phosphatase [Phycisphaerales bacterium]
MGRVLIVSNRLPVSVSATPDGSLSFSRSVGGLATGMASLDSSDQLWIGWPGLPSDHVDADQQRQIEQRLAEEHCRPVWLSRTQVEDYYDGFSNKTIWPLFHYFPLYCIYEPHLWRAYQEVNERFARVVCEMAQPDDTIWVHDYQLMLLPRLLREHLPDAAVGFFLHIPFPSYELLRLLPWRRDLLDGMLGADLVGFHEYDYVRHFLSSAHRITGHEHVLGTLSVANRPVRVDAFPMGIDYDAFARAAARPQIQENIQTLRRRFGTGRTIVSIDRLDYTKGILHRLEAFDWLLSCRPEYRGTVSLVLVAVPSRTNVPRYQELRTRIEHLVGRINGAYGTLRWTPIHYLYRSLPFEELVALYRIADVALITPLRDGMNLVAKEYVASQEETGGHGVLILSEMAGAASELSEAIIVNPHDKHQVVEALHRALEMPAAERRHRNEQMQQRLRRYTVRRWAADFVESLAEVKARQAQLALRRITPELRDQVVEAYRGATRRLILLDYDGTLVHFFPRPEQARPDAGLQEMLRALASDRRNTVVVISGRDRETLQSWLGELPIHLVAEHGNWTRRRDGDWQCIENHGHDWKGTLRPILERYVDRTPGAFIEEKDFSLVWHCRRSEPDLAHLRIQELRAAILPLTENLNLGVFEGSKILEVKSIAAHKGSATEAWLHEEPWDFVLAAGDDYTDEDMFAALGDNAMSIKVGRGASHARFSVDTVEAMRDLLERLTRA